MLKLLRGLKISYPILPRQIQNKWKPNLRIFLQSFVVKIVFKFSQNNVEYSVKCGIQALFPKMIVFIMYKKWAMLSKSQGHTPSIDRSCTLGKNTYKSSFNKSLDPSFTKHKYPSVSSS